MVYWLIGWSGILVFSSLINLINIINQFNGSEIKVLFIRLREMGNFVFYINDEPF
jgi:hypothetical protein